MPSKFGIKKKAKVVTKLTASDVVGGLVIIANKLQAEMGTDSGLIIVHQELRKAIASIRQQLGVNQ